MGDRRPVAFSEGFGRSNAATFVIPNGANGSSVAAVDLGRGYAFHVIRCLDLNLAANSRLKIQVAEDDSDTLCDLYKTDDPDSLFLSDDLPTDGTWRFLLTHAFGAQRLRLILVASDGTTAKNVTAETTFTIYGYDGTRGG